MDDKDEDFNFRVYPVQPKPYNTEIDPITNALIEYIKDLKRLLRLAVDDLQTAMLEEKCKVCGLEHCDYDEICKWRYHDEAMKLLGGTENAEN